MNRMLTCKACGHIGLDVEPRVVELTPTRTTETLRDYPAAPERFRVEARCIDHEACEDRQFEKEPA